MQLELDLASLSETTGRKRLPLELKAGSARRRRVEAVLEVDHILVTHPPRMSPVEARRIGEELRARLERRATTTTIDLTARARDLAKRYSLPVPDRIEWSERQLALWGVCTQSGTVRISSRLAEVPRFVLDAVIVHELSHLVHLNHGPAFHELTRRFQKTDMAMGYLMALDHQRRNA